MKYKPVKVVIINKKATKFKYQIVYINYVKNVYKKMNVLHVKSLNIKKTKICKFKINKIPQTTIF